MLCELYKKSKNKNNRLYVFFNGFGADYTYWDYILPYFAEEDYILLSENYFNLPEDYDEKYLKKIVKGKELIGVGHSLGYHKVCALNQDCDFFNLKKVVSLEGFSHYLGRFEPMRSVRRFFLDLMKTSYTYYPEVTLFNFMLMCGAPIIKFPEQLNMKLLMDDLSLLYTGIESPDIPHLVLSSFDDWVIPSNIIEDNFRGLKDVEIVYTMGAGHLLGMKFPEYVADKIKKFADQK